MRSAPLIQLITYDALGLCEPGKACEFMESGATTSPLFDSDRVKANPPPRRVIVNPSGGLISKGHPLGFATANKVQLAWLNALNSPGNCVVLLERDKLLVLETLFNTTSDLVVLLS